MAIDKNPEARGYIASCDFCSHTEELEEANGFFDALDAIKEDNWLITRIGSVWKHKCAHCVTKTSK